MTESPFPSRAGSMPAFAPAIGLREVLEAAPDLIFCCDASGRFAWASSTFEYFAGWRASDLVGQSFLALIPAEDRPRVVRHFLRQLRRGRPQSVGDFVLMRKDGTRAEITARVRLYERPDGDRYFVGVARERQVAAVPEPAPAPAAPPAPAPAPVAVADLAERALFEARIQELQRQLDDSRQGEALKSEVLAMLGEQLRPPMDAVLGASAALLSAKLPSEHQRLVEAIRGAGQALVTLVSDANDHAQLESGRMEIERLGFDLRLTIEQVSTLIGGMAGPRGLQFETRIDPVVPSRLLGDPGRLRQVLLSLGSNAVRYTEHGRITLSVDRESEDDAHVTLFFRLSEPMSGEAAQHRAQMFREPAPGQALAPNGADLAMSISRRLVHLMGGLQGAEAGADGGTTFWFRVTFEKQAVPAAAMAHHADVRLRGIRVLVADGQGAQRRAHAEMLRAWGCVVDEAENGLEAMEAVRIAHANGESYRIALLDMSLEGLDGHTLAGALRQDPDLDRLVVVLTTRLGRPGDAHRAREHGISAYLVLPVEPSLLFEALAELIANGHEALRPTERPLVTRHSLAESRRSRVRILIVDDDAVNQLVTKSALNRVGFHATVAASGREAIERTEGERWDLVLMNLQMPDLDGLSATTAIRARERGAWRTPIIGLSTSSDVSRERDRCLAAGMDDVLGKPLDLSSLTESVQRWTLHDDSRPAEAEVEEDSAPRRRGPAPLTVVSGHFDPPGESSADDPLTTLELPAGPAIDLDQLNVASMGLPALRTSLLHTYVGDVQPRLSRLEAAIDAADLERAEFEAHGLRSMCATVGATACTVVFGELETRARERRGRHLRTLLAMAREQVKRSEDYVARFDRILESDAA